jgi:outer membrane murein-binding lipoprotein Lpp
MANSQDNVSLDLLRRQLDRISDSLNANEEVLSQHGGGDGRPPMANTDGRIGRLEAAMEGLKHSQNLLAVAVLGVGAILVALGIYSLQRIDTISDRVSALPSQVGSELRDLTKTLADVIIAAKQTQPTTAPPIPPTPQKR